jgi:hypothetical protein
MLGIKKEEVAVACTFFVDLLLVKKNKAQWNLSSVNENLIDNVDNRVANVGHVMVDTTYVQQFIQETVRIDSNRIRIFVVSATTRDVHVHVPVHNLSFGEMMTWERNS